MLADDTLIYINALIYIYDFIKSILEVYPAYEELITTKDLFNLMKNLFVGSVVFVNLKCGF